MSHERIRVLCVDDHQFLADGVRSRLVLEKDLEFAGWIGSAERLLEEVDARDAQVVLLDIDMPPPDPFERAEHLSRRRPGVRVIFFSAFLRDHYIDRAIQVGAWGYLSKADDPASIAAAIRKVHRGEFAFGHKVLERCQVGSNGRLEARPNSRLQSLSEREVEVLRLFGQGLNRVQVARQLHRSPKTIDNHRANMMKKLQIHTQVDLVRFAISEGLVEP